MSKIRLFYVVTTLIAILTFYGFTNYGGGGGKALEEVDHINNNYWLTVNNHLYESVIEESEGYRGEYPGGSEIDNLYNSGLWVGVSGSSGPKVSVSCPNDGHEFEEVSVIYTNPGNWDSSIPVYGDFDVCVTGNDRNAEENGQIPVTVSRHTWSFTDSNLDDCIGFKYIIRNDSNEIFSDVYISHFADYDIGGSLEYLDDLVGVDVGREMAYMYDDDASPDNYIGVVCGTGDWTSVGMQYWNIGTDPADDASRLDMQQKSGWFTEDRPYDWRFLYTFHFDGDDFEPGEKIIAGFYQVAGTGLAELQSNADAAVASYIEDDHGLTNIKSASLGQIKAIYR